MRSHSSAPVPSQSASGDGDRPAGSGRQGWVPLATGLAIVSAIGLIAAYAEMLTGPLSQSMELNFLLVVLAFLWPVLRRWLNPS